MPPCCGPTRPDPHPRRADGDPLVGPLPAPTTSAAAERPTFVEIPAGAFVMGSDGSHGYATDGEGPAHDVSLDVYAIGVHAVTNAEFAIFVDATRYRTTAEVHGTSFVFAGLLPEDSPPTRGVTGAPWWRLVEGADWRHPEGPGSDIDGRVDHPAVHVSWFDARAYGDWLGARLPTEAEWERAARGPLVGARYPWGDELAPDGDHRMNVFQGSFPDADTGDDGWVGTAPVGAYPANGFGLHEVTGNVWEWCADWFDPGYYARSARHGPRGPDAGAQRVMRGGSYLCHDSYCNRYRVDARSANTPDSSAGNIGFRVATTRTSWPATG